MKSFKFNTNINCSGCIAAVGPALDSLDGVKSWQVDTVNPSKVLSIEAEDHLDAQHIKDAVTSKGFNISEA